MHVDEVEIPIGGVEIVIDRFTMNDIRQISLFTKKIVILYRFASQRVLLQIFTPASNSSYTVIPPKINGVHE
ncbi:MAG: hypothetical protein P8L68_02860 [Paracoccaceae bacterium]|nr:hypothetical protein [Paracoccaceae bacterium]